MLLASVEQRRHAQDRCLCALLNYHQFTTVGSWLCVDPYVCAGGCACSKSFVLTTTLCPPDRLRPADHPDARELRRNDDLTLAQSNCSWLTVSRAHESVLLCEQPPGKRASRCMLQRLKRAASWRIPCVLLVSRLVLAMCVHAERCRVHAAHPAVCVWVLAW